MFLAVNQFRGWATTWLVETGIEKNFRSKGDIGESEARGAPPAPVDGATARQPPALSKSNHIRSAAGSAASITSATPPVKICSWKRTQIEPIGTICSATEMVHSSGV